MTSTADQVRAESVAQINAAVTALTVGNEVMPLLAVMRHGKRRLVLGFVREGDWGQNWEWMGDYVQRVGADAVVVTMDSFVRTTEAGEPYPYAEGGEPGNDPRAGEAVISWGLSHREGDVRVDVSVLLPYGRADDGSIAWHDLTEAPALIGGEVASQVADALRAPRGDDLAGVVVDARKAGHRIVLVNGTPWRNGR